MRIPFSWLAFIVVLLVLRGVATFASPTWLWGLDSLADRGALWTLLLIPFALPLFKSPMLQVGRVISALAEKSVLLLLGFTGVLGAVFVLFRSRNFLLGDSLLYVHAMREGIQIESAGRREAGATLIVSALDWSLGKTAVVDSQIAFVVASVAAGVTYVILVFALSRLLARTAEARAFIFASLLGVGALQIFFGHAEYYSLVAASGMFYVFLSLRWLKGEGNLAFPALALATALFVHLMNVLLVLSFIWLLIYAVRSRHYIQAVVATFLVPLVLMSAAAVVRYPRESFVAIFARGKHVLPFSSYDPDFFAYGLSSSTHLIEVANELLLTAPCLPLLLLAVAVSAQRRAAPEPADDGPPAFGEAPSWAASGFLAFATVGAALFILIANPALGMARDWDIFAFPFILCTLAASVAASGRLRDRRYILWLCGAIAVVGGVHLALFVDSNRTPSAYVPRFRRLAAQEKLFAPTPRAELWRYLGWEALKADDVEQARSDLLRSVEDYGTQVKAYKMLAVIEIGRKFDWLASRRGAARRRALELDSEELMTAEATRLGLNQYYGTIAEEAPNKVRALIGAGIAAMKVGAPDSLVVGAFRRAVEADPEDLEAQAFWADMLRAHGRLDEAEAHYQWVLSRRRWQIRAVIGRACILGARGEPEMAYVLVKELRERYPWSIEAQQFLQERRKGKLSTPEDYRTFIVTQ